MESILAPPLWQVLYFFLPAYLANMAPVLIAGRLQCLRLEEAWI